MAFNLNRAVGYKRGFFTNTGVGKVRPRVEITEEEVERWAAQGLTRKQMAKEKNISYGYMNNRIGASYTLSQAEIRGKEKCQKNKKH